MVEILDFQLFFLILILEKSNTKKKIFLRIHYKYSVFCSIFNITSTVTDVKSECKRKSNQTTNEMFSS